MRCYGLCGRNLHLGRNSGLWRGLWRGLWYGRNLLSLCGLWRTRLALNKGRQRGTVAYIKSFFLTEPCKFHQCQLNVQSLVGGGAETSIDLAEECRSTKEETYVATCALLFVAVEQRARNLQQRERLGLLAHQQIPQVGCQSRCKTLP